MIIVRINEEKVVIYLGNDYCHFLCEYLYYQADCSEKIDKDL
jgi:hypothetical protein